MERCGGFDESYPGLFLGGGIVADAAGDDEELAGADRHGTAVRLGAADAEESTEDEEHFVVVLMGVPGKLALDLRHFDVLVVDLTNDSRRPELLKSGAG